MSIGLDDLAKGQRLAGVIAVDIHGANGTEVE